MRSDIRHLLTLVLLLSLAAETLCQRPTVASLLRDAGYHTVVVGKWHVPAPPWKCGFDEVRTWLPEGGAEYRDPDLVRGVSAEHKSIPGFTQEIFANDALEFLHGKDLRTRLTEWMRRNGDPALSWPAKPWRVFRKSPWGLTPVPSPIPSRQPGEGRHHPLAANQPRNSPSPGGWEGMGEGVRG